MHPWQFIDAQLMNIIGQNCAWQDAYRRRLKYTTRKERFYHD